MQRVTGIGGLFFRAQDPVALAAWYREHLGIDGPYGLWAQEAGQTVFSPFAKDTDYFGRDSQQWMINFRVADLGAMIAQLAKAGIVAETKPEWNSPEVGQFARISDPDGNPIELWQPA